MKKLQKVLKPEEYAATISAAGASETQDRLKSQYLALEQEYRRVIDRMERDEITYWKEEYILYG